MAFPWFLDVFSASQDLVSLTASISASANSWPMSLLLYRKMEQRSALTLTAVLKASTGHWPLALHFLCLATY